MATERSTAVPGFADPKRLQAPSQRVSVTNTDTKSKHIVIDRYLAGHEFDPGQTKELEMLTDDIADFQRRAEFNHPIRIKEAPGRSPEQAEEGRATNVPPVRPPQQQPQARR